ncbi:thioredoxin domain-containing protein 6 [Chytridiales sp. JEL 0842]|nr:thioredoxin domain-containing protein 6 [Chytridiales sp. JEL 0842]
MQSADIDPPKPTSRNKKTLPKRTSSLSQPADSPPTSDSVSSASETPKLEARKNPKGSYLIFLLLLSAPIVIILCAIFVQPTILPLPIQTSLKQTHSRLLSLIPPSLLYPFISSPLPIFPQQQEQQQRRTLALLKPHAYPIHLPYLKSFIHSNGLHITHEKELHMTNDLVEQFYQAHVGKKYWNELKECMAESPTYALVLTFQQGQEREEGVVRYWRSLMGPTDPEKAAEGQVRKVVGKDLTRNGVHGSDSPSEAEREIKVIFGQI